MRLVQNGGDIATVCRYAQVGIVIDIARDRPRPSTRIRNIKNLVARKVGLLMPNRAQDACSARKPCRTSENARTRRKKLLLLSTRYINRNESRDRVRRLQNHARDPRAVGGPCGKEEIRTDRSGRQHALRSVIEGINEELIFSGLGIVVPKKREPVSVGRERDVRVDVRD